MKLELNFQVKNNEFPLDYRRLIISFLKCCLSSSGGSKHMEKYYEPGMEKEYSFAVFFEKPTFLPDKIQLEGSKVKVNFTTADKFTGFVFYSAFLENKNKVFPIENGNEMKLLKVTEYLHQKVLSNQILVQTASPLCIRKHNSDTNKDYYYSYLHEDYKEAFLFVIKRQLQNAGFSDEDVSNLNIEPIKCRKVIIKHYGINVESSIGKFILEGKIEILQYLLDSGCGSRKSSGFGMLELISNG